MAILSKGTTFTTGEQVTALSLNNLVDNATFASGAVDGSTTALDGDGKIIVKDGGITSAKLPSGGLTSNLKITSGGTVFPNSPDNGYLQISNSDGSNKLAIDPNEILTHGGGLAIRVPDGQGISMQNVNAAGDDVITNLKITSGGSVGINTSSPEATLHVKDIGTTQPCILVEDSSIAEGDIAVRSGETLQMGHWNGSAFTNRFQFNSSGVAEVFGTDSTGNSILILNSTGTDDTSALMFSNQVDGDDDVGQIGYDHTNNKMKFRVNAAERATLNGTGVFEPTLALKCSGINLVSTFSGSDLVTSANIDHMWYDDTNDGSTKGTFHFVADTTYHATGNADCRARVFTTASDHRLKEDIKDIEDSISKVQSLKPVNFSWIATGENQDGFIAHEVQEVVPLAVNGAKDAVKEDGTPIYQGLDQSKLIPILTKALQEALTKIESLEARVAALES